MQDLTPKNRGVQAVRDQIFVPLRARVVVTDVRPVLARKLSGPKLSGPGISLIELPFGHNRRSAEASISEPCCRSWSECSIEGMLARRRRSMGALFIAATVSPHSGRGRHVP